MSLELKKRRRAEQTGGYTHLAALDIQHQSGKRLVTEQLIQQGVENNRQAAELLKSRGYDTGREFEVLDESGEIISGTIGKINANTGMVGIQKGTIGRITAFRLSNLLKLDGNKVD